ncbi:Permease of the drug/metabolite transporter (DMT) superfamily [Aneurinibacillus thermoaerophilus]|uniref:Permease of the drug/metabolite transporter (DMT) superfamily n=1 Tax=Aneurinibacillus thermoaerophilus TaxID=143495 RepID=A0A1G7ZVI0_ANETH|nr:Permease of the drug/metabolite transporter (DMT) superfamily [Aneurinibacillus thermoaerophilus]
MLKKSIIADGILLLVALVWGATFVVVQNAIAKLPPLTFNGIRFFLASIFLLLFLLLFYRPQLRQINGKLIRAGVILGAWLFSGYAFQTIGLLYTTSSKAGFITGLSVVLVPVFALLILKQRPRMPAIIGALLATAGLYLLTLGDTFSINQGDLLVFMCAICFALQIIFTGRYAPHFPSLALAFVQILTVAVLSGGAAFFFEDWQSSLTWETLTLPSIYWALLITAIPATALAFLAQTECQRFTTTTRVALIYAMEPVFAAITAYLFNGEILGGRALIGCLFIFTGMILSELQTEQLTSWIKKRNTSY